MMKTTNNALFLLALHIERHWIQIKALRAELATYLERDPYFESQESIKLITLLNQCCDEVTVLQQQYTEKAGVHRLSYDFANL